MRRVPKVSGIPAFSFLCGGILQVLESSLESRWLTPSFGFGEQEAVQ